MFGTFPAVVFSSQIYLRVFDDRKTTYIMTVRQPLSLHCAFRLRILCSRSDINDDAWHVSLFQSLSYVWGDDTLKTYPYVGATVICVSRRPDKWASDLADYMVGGPVVVS